MVWAPLGTVSRVEFGFLDWPLIWGDHEANSIAEECASPKVHCHHRLLPASGKTASTMLPHSEQKPLPEFSLIEIP